MAEQMPHVSCSCFATMPFGVVDLFHTFTWWHFGVYIRSMAVTSKILATFPCWSMEGVMVEIGADVLGLMLMFDNGSLIMHGCRSLVLRISPFL